MIDRNTYCKDCDCSIYATGILARSCDANIEDNGYYNLAGEKCYCKIVNGKRAEKYPWESEAMREILFRGKRISDNTWVYGGIMKTFHPNFEHESEGAFVLQKENCYCICANRKDYFVEQESIGQYTGLCDKNGKMIFEGDIIHSLYANCKINEHVEKVVFRDGCFKAENVEGGFFAKIAGQGSPKHLPNDTSVYMIECEVIGNIHDNPELLEGGAE